jgi:hypothetical protein
VKVKSPGAEVRSRTGYFALPDSAQVPPKSAQAIISQTAVSQLDATGIGMRVHVQAASSAAEQALNIDLHLEPHDIHLEQNDAVWTGALQTVFLQLNNRGEIIQALDETLQLTLPQNLSEQALKDGLKNTKHIRILPPCCATMRRSPRPFDRQYRLSLRSTGKVFPSSRHTGRYTLAAHTRALSLTFYQSPSYM